MDIKVQNEHLIVTNPLVICGFPGIGKTYTSQRTGCCDSDSSMFSWIEPGVRHPDFPKNYIGYIRQQSGIVLVSSHVAVRDALSEEEIPFVVAYPALSLKEEYKQRYWHRGSSDKFVQLLDEHWDEWIKGMENEERALSHLVLLDNQYLIDVLPMYFNLVIKSL